jgi:hypothetical protein
MMEKKKASIDQREHKCSQFPQNDGSNNTINTEKVAGHDGTLQSSQHSGEGTSVIVPSQPTLLSDTLPQKKKERNRKKKIKRMMRITNRRYKKTLYTCMQLNYHTP